MSEIPMEWKVKIYFEDEFDPRSKTGKFRRYKKYIHYVRDYIESEMEHVVSYDEKLQIKELIEDFERDYNSKYNLNMHTKREGLVFPILVVDSDGMDPDKIHQLFSKVINENKKPKMIAGGFDILEFYISRHRVFGKFGLLIQSDNLETCNFEGYKPDRELQEDDVTSAFIGLESKKKRKRSRYGNVSFHSIKEKMIGQKSVYLPEMMTNNSATICDPDSLQREIGKLYDYQTSSIYLNKKGLKKAKQSKKPKPSKLGLSLDFFEIPNQNY